MATDPCDDSCLPQLDIVQIEELYDMFNLKVRADLQEDYDCKKINGATYADTWAKLIGPLIGSILNSSVALKTKETPDDRALKQAQTAEIALESIRRDCTTTANCALVDAQELKVDAETELVVAQESKVLYEVSDILPASKDLTIRQTAGFDDNIRQKLFEAQINAWSMMFSSGLLEDAPTIISNDDVSGLYDTILSYTTDTPGNNPLSAFSAEVSMTQPVAEQSTVSWGTVTGATSYMLYVDSVNGSLAGYPKVVTADGMEIIDTPTPGDNISIAYNARVVASDVTGYNRSSSYTLRVYGPIV